MRRSALIAFTAIAALVLVQLPALAAPYGKGGQTQYEYAQDQAESDTEHAPTKKKKRKKPQFQTRFFY